MPHAQDLVGVLLAFGDADRATDWSLEKLRKVIERDLEPLHLPPPRGSGRAALAIGLVLSRWMETDNTGDRLTVGTVVVPPDDGIAEFSGHVGRDGEASRVRKLPVLQLVEIEVSAADIGLMVKP